MMLAFPLVFGICNVAYNFVPIFYGKGYDKVAPLLCIISPIIIFIELSNVTGTQYLLPTKQQNKYKFSVVVGAIVNFTLNMFLIKRYASIGASIATVIAELSVTTTQFILVKDEIKFIEVIRLSYKYFIISLLMYICSIIIGLLIKQQQISLLIQIITSVIVYYLIFITLKDNMINELIHNVKKKIKELRK